MTSAATEDGGAGKPSRAKGQAKGRAKGASDPAPGLDVIGLIVENNRGRDPRLLARKFDAIAESPFDFLRATAVIGHAALARDTVPDSPLAWVTGDLHVENFGTYKAANGLVYFDLNDFDEAARLPVAVDLVRLLASMIAAGEANGLTRETSRELLGAVLARIAEVLSCGKALWVERELASGRVQAHIEEAGGGRRRDLFKKMTTRTDEGRRLKCDGKRLLAFDDAAQRTAITQAVEALARQRGEPVEILDIALRVAGKGALGRPRFALLARGTSDPTKILLDLKSAAPSSAAARFGLTQPAFASEAHRIVAIEERCQVMTPEWLSACLVGETSYLLRILQPAADKIEIDELDDDVPLLTELFTLMGQIHASALLRSAGRQGSAGPDEIIAFGEVLGGQAADWVAAAERYEAANRNAFDVFRTAWEARDPRLLALTEAGPSAPA